MRLSATGRALALATPIFAAAFVPGTTAHASDAWPAHVVKFVVPFTPGGANDLVARAAADAVSKRLGQTVIIENRPGAGGIVGADYVAKSKPDGYTFLVGAVGTVTNELIRSKMPYASDDLVPVSLIAVSPSVIVAAPSLPANNLKELVAYSKKQPGGVNFATAGSGSTPHFVEEMLKEKGAALTPVPYKSGSESITAVIGGQVAATSEASVVVLPQIKAGKLKALGATWDKRMSAAPNIPTTAEQGMPEVRIGHWAGIFAPKGTDPAIVKKLNAEMTAAMQTQETRERLLPNGIEPAGGSVESFVAFIKSERERLGRIAKNANMSAD
ncbi:Twin-arginine translocation pathway signal [Cupriavidus sp. USMAA2-4]|uniref:Twin-arginine translocation pathway signal n=1 Tax=Cupriavidus malaysiensis TaxID=367825 RepID=A0ABN4TR16_9BURK|nr:MULTISPECIES: tripartite tricarboxylate transporter substrate binding protein [Cupriavidus]AOY92719.1 Twin-arginine translocation pathway signal [Cupriavidus sp. USMAA2-4]AOZ00808.1 Twin-arginine translocation pathway signal [Cupriavidus sp. USMAHM13]AOZ07568.1 Twin-arginine translocation pathway signal [Cupriavidus malaysiensis]